MPADFNFPDVVLPAIEPAKPAEPAKPPPRVRGQRAETKEKGLPATTCANDLFTRIDQLTPDAAAHKDWPVRYFLGFRSVVPDRAFVAPDSWTGRVIKAFGPVPGQPNWAWVARYWATQVFMWTIYALGFWTDVIVASKIGPGGCSDPRLGEIKADIAAKELICKIVGSDPTWFTQVDMYARNYICPNQTLDAGQAVSGYLANELDEKAVHDYGRANNLCDVAIDVIVASAQQRLGPGQLDQLLDRGHVTREVYDAEMRGLGWIKSQYVDWQRDLSAWWPDSGTVIGWARRGTASEQNAATLKLDQGFGDAMTPQVKKWLAGNNVSDEQAKLLWRAQFGPPDVETAKKWYRYTVAGLLPGAAAFTADDLAFAVRQSGIAPDYRAQMLATVYEPLGMRQLKTAYVDGIINGEAVTTGLIAGGFAPAESAVLLEQWSREKPAHRRRKIGATSAGGFLGLYASGVIGERELLTELAGLGLAGDELAEARAEARAERMRKHRGELIGYLKARYLKGEIDESRVQAVLLSTGLEGADVADLLRLWRTEFEVHPRQASAAELVSWYKQGLIREPELASALAQLRYSAADSIRVIAAADAAKSMGQLRQAEQLVVGAGKRLADHDKQWRAELDKAERLAGKVEQRTVTNAGKLLGWVSKRVVGPVKPVSKGGKASGQFYYEDEAATMEAASFVAGKNGGAVVPGDGIASIGEDALAALIEPAALTPEPEA